MTSTDRNCLHIRSKIYAPIHCKRSSKRNLRVTLNDITICVTRYTLPQISLVTIKLVGHSSMAMRYKFATSRRLLQTYKKRWETYKPSVSMCPYKSIKLDFSHNFINFEIRARKMIKAGEEQ
uniref:Uncharacterized protein n=1 Tax=Glossina palpalis gambiensis TaxID=67801 RepID=A0A1B0B1T8_9MUSC